MKTIKMKNGKLTGYCLWCAHPMLDGPRIGQPWLSVKATIWVMKSKNSVCPVDQRHIGWREIVKVEGIVNYREENGFYITNEPYKLFITEICGIYKHKHPGISDKEWLSNAKEVLDVFSQKIRDI